MIKRWPFEGYQKLGEIFFASSENATPIQAADLLAYELNKYARERLAARWARVAPREVMRRALKNIKGSKRDFKVFDKYGLDIALRSFRSKKETAKESP